MKILLIEPCPVNSGGHKRSFSICSALNHKGVKTDLLLSSDKKNFFSIKKTKVNGSFFQYELPRFNFHHYFNGRILRALIGFIFGLFGKYDLIFARVPTQLESNIPAFLLKLSGKKVAIDWDDYWMGSPIFKKQNLIKRYVKFCETKTPIFFENIVAISGFLEEKAKKFGAKRIFKLNNGVIQNEFKKRDKDESYRKLKLDKKKKYLIFIGSTCSKSRTLLIFRFLEKIRKLDRNVLLICNFDPTKKIMEHGLKDRVNEDCLKGTIGMGYISNDNLEYCFSICRGAIFLQDEVEDEMACHPVRVMSYLSADCPVIMNDIGSEISLIMNKYDCAIIDNDLDILAKKTIDFFNNEKIQQKLQQNMLVAKDKMSWNNVANGLVAYFTEVIDS
jgi:hypothetical protein